MKTLLLVTLALSISACASVGPKRLEFQDTTGKARAEQVRDFDDCLLISRTVKPSLQLPEQVSCMERRGYTTVEVAQ